MMKSPRYLHGIARPGGDGADALIGSAAMFAVASAAGFPKPKLGHVTGKLKSQVLCATEHELKSTCEVLLY